jgi:hypothetical protein
MCNFNYASSIIQTTGTLDTKITGFVILFFILFLFLEIFVVYSLGLKN